MTGLHAILADAHQNSSSSHIQSSKGTNFASDLMIDVIRAAEAGDHASRNALINSGQRVGRTIGTYLINVYNPSLVLLDGGTIRATKGDTVYLNELFLDSLYESAAASSLPVAFAGTKIMPGKLGEDAVGLGVVAPIIDSLFETSF